LDSARLLRPLQQHHVEAGYGVFPSEVLSQAKERLQQFPERIALSEERAQKEARRVCENAIIHGSLFQAVTEAKDSGGQGRMAFSIHAARNSLVSCNWCCGLHPGAALSVA
jgi:hypothetical protein